MSEPAGTFPGVEPARGWRALFPPAQWLRGYPVSWLRFDIVAGITLAAYAIPVSLAYATLAGLPPQHGIYCYLFGGIAYALLGTSRQVAIGPTSAISLLVGTTIAGMAAGDPARWLEIAVLTGLAVAALSVIAWALRLSALVNFISETILLGFKAGAALTIAMTQLPKLFGVKGGGDNFFERVWTLIQQIPQTNVAVLAFGLVAIALLVAGDKLMPARPVALVVVIASILALTFTPLAQMGFKTVGMLPPGLPHLALPSLTLREVDGVLPLAAACLLLAYIEGVSAARAIAERHGYEVDPRQELLALGAANFAAAVGQGYPVAGGLSQSSVNDKAGAKTPLALVFASIAIGIALLATGLLQNLPDVMLAAIVLVAVSGLINIPELRRVWSLSKMEFGVAMIALAGVLIFGILKGVLLAAIASLLLLLRRVAYPHVARLGRIKGTHRYSDVLRHPDNETVPGVLIVRVEASILYFNVPHIRDEVRRFIADFGPELRRVIWDMSTSPYVDLAGAKLVAEIDAELERRKLDLRIVDAHSTVRELIRKRCGRAVGEVSRRISIEDAMTEA
jgi:high affinity sulfate transporter 1